MNDRFEKESDTAEACLDHLASGNDYYFLPPEDLSRENIYAQDLCQEYSQEFESREPNLQRQKTTMAGQLLHYFPTTKKGVIVDATYLQFSPPFYGKFPLPTKLIIPNNAPKILIADTLEDVERILKQAQIPNEYWAFWLDQLAA